MSDDIHREFLLSCLRAASLRAKIFEVDVNSIGLALKSGMISVPEALKWIKDIGAMESMGMIPDEILNGTTDHQPERNLKRVGI